MNIFWPWMISSWSKITSPLPWHFRLRRKRANVLWIWRRYTQSWQSKLLMWQHYKAKASGCFWHPFIKVFGDANGQDAKDPFGERCFWGPLRPNFSKVSIPFPLPICLCSTSFPSSPPLALQKRETSATCFPHWHPHPSGSWGRVSRDKKKELICSEEGACLSWLTAQAPLGS